jgi:hypothetical protein
MPLAPERLNLSLIRLENVDCPTGKSEPRVRTRRCPAPSRKIFRLTRRANQRYRLRRPARERGVSRSSRTRVGMRWTRQRRRGRWFAGRSFRERTMARRTNGACCVRQNRVVPTPVAGAKLSVAASIRPDRLSHQAGSDGDKTNSSPGRARHKP